MINPILQTDGPESNSGNNMRNTGYNRGNSGAKKIILIMIIVLISIIVVGGGIFAYTYFFTDAFINEEQGFYKYISHNSQVLEMFNDEDLNKYVEKTQNQGYSSNGEFSVAFSGDIDEESQKAIDEIQKHKITFNSNVDSVNKYSYNEIGLKYGETDVISGALVQQNDYFGLKVNDIGLNPYIVLENNNLKQFAKNLGLSDEEIASIPDKIDFEKLANQEIFTKEELQQIKDRYLKAIKDNLTKDMFSQKEQDGMKVYTLTINEQNGKVLISALMSTLKDDDLVLNKFKQLYIEQSSATEEEAQALIDSLKTSLDEAINELNGTSENTGITPDLNSIQTDMIQPETTEESESIYISVYVTKKNLVKTEVFIENEGKFIINNNENKASIEIVVAENEDTGTTYKTTGIFSLEKNKTDSELTYIFGATAIDDGKNKEMLKVNVSYTGLKEMTNVGSSILFDIYNYPNDSILAAANKAKIESENLEEREKVQLAIISLMVDVYADTYTSDNEVVLNETTIKEALDKQGVDMTVSRNEDGTYRLLSNTTGNIFTIDSKGEITNTEYAETANTDEAEEKVIIASLNLKGNTTFGEVQQQELSNKYLVNEKSLEQLESLFTQLGQRVGNKFKGVYKNTIFSEMIEEYNNGGVLTPPVYDAAKDAINSTSSSLSEQEKSIFNSKFIPYEGPSVSGPQVNSLIQAVITSNETEINGSKKYIKITFPSISGGNQEIDVKDNKVTYSNFNVTNKVNQGKKYKVTLEYDENKVVNEILIKEN